MNLVDKWIPHDTCFMLSSFLGDIPAGEKKKRIIKKPNSIHQSVYFRDLVLQEDLSDRITIYHSKTPSGDLLRRRNKVLVLFSSVKLRHSESFHNENWISLNQNTSRF